MLLTFQGFFEEGKFIPSESVKIPEYKKAIVTILDEVKEDDKIKQQLAELDRLEKMLDNSMNEDVSEFTRANLHREVVI